MRESVAMPFIVNIIAITVAVTIPTVTENEGFLWFFPLYQPTWLQNVFTIGSFYWVYFYSWLTHGELTSKYNEKVYDFVIGSSMWGYLSHYMWIVLVVQALVRPFKLSLFPAILVNYVFGQLLICLSYILLQKLSGLCSKKKNDE